MRRHAPGIYDVYFIASYIFKRLFDARALRGVEKCNPHLWSVSPGKPANPSSKIIRIEKR